MKRFSKVFQRFPSDMAYKVVGMPLIMLIKCFLFNRLKVKINTLQIQPKVIRATKKSRENDEKMSFYGEYQPLKTKSDLRNFKVFSSNLNF